MNSIHSVFESPLTSFDVFFLVHIHIDTCAHKIVGYHQPNFYKDPCKDARAQVENARTCDALQRFRSESTKIKKMRFSAIFE